MKYNVEFENGYVKSFVKDENGAFEFNATEMKLEYLNCYKASGTTLILDEEKYNRLIDKKSIEDEINKLKEELNSTDYKIIKCSEYQLAQLEPPYDIAELHATRQVLRDKINELESE